VPIEGGPLLAMSMSKALTVITGILGIVILITGIIQLGQTRKAERIRYKEE
jgi:low affinity Fe/Cu permease